MLLLRFWLFLFAFAALAQPPGSDAERAIRAVLQAQAEAWNRGDITRFMEAYENSPDTTFVGREVTKGYGQVLARYQKRYPTPAAMGKLAFSSVEVRVLCADYASVTGQWALGRANTAGGNTGGVYTLLFRRTAQGWKIMLDHTS